MSGIPSVIPHFAKNGFRPNRNGPSGTPRGDAFAHFRPGPTAAVDAFGTDGRDQVFDDELKTAVSRGAIVQLGFC